MNRIRIDARVLLLFSIAACDSPSAPAVARPNNPQTPPVVVPASIVINAPTANLQVGGTTQLSATVLDNTGAVMTGQTITWSTSNAGVAAVSNAGLVTALTAGAAQIAAAVGTVNTQLDFNITARVAVPGALVFEDLFETGTYLVGSSGARWVGGGSGNVNVCGGGAGGSSFALCLTHRAKLPGLMSSAEQRFRLINGSPELWIEYDFLVPANFYHRLNPTNSPNNKFLALWEENYTGEADDGVTPTPLLIFEFRPMNDSPSRAGELGSSYVYLHGNDRTGKLHGGYGPKWLSAFGSWNRGQWLQIRVHARLSTSDTTNDGFVKLYADGKLVIDAVNLPLHSSSNARYLRNGYLLGWSNSGYDADTEFKVDNIKFYSNDPGW
jgi:hypothetical protein